MGVHPNEIRASKDWFIFFVDYSLPNGPNLANWMENICDQQLWSLAIDLSPKVDCNTWIHCDLNYSFMPHCSSKGWHFTCLKPLGVSSRFSSIALCLTPLIVSSTSISFCVPAGKKSIPTTCFPHPILPWGQCTVWVFCHKYSQCRPESLIVVSHNKSTFSTRATSAQLFGVFRWVRVYGAEYVYFPMHVAKQLHAWINSYIP